MPKKQAEMSTAGIENKNLFTQNKMSKEVYFISVGFLKIILQIEMLWPAAQFPISL